MSKTASLPLWRDRLDQAITYGTKKAARAIARQALKQALAKHFSSEAEYFKGQLAMLAGKPNKAIEHFDCAISLNPHDGGAYNDRALCMVEIGIIDQALDYFNRGISVEPEYATIYHNKGWLLNNIGRHTEAIVCFKKALLLEPNRPVTYDNLADAWFNLGGYEAAYQAYSKVLKLLKPGQCRSIRKQIILKLKELEINLSKGA